MSCDTLRIRAHYCLVWRITASLCMFSGSDLSDTGGDSTCFVSSAVYKKVTDSLTSVTV